MSDPQSNATAIWYERHAPLYAGLTEVVATTITKLLKVNKIDYLTLGSRMKSLESVVEKMDRKEYSSPEDITDLAGIRVITYIETDIEKVGKLMGQAFRVH